MKVSIFGLGYVGCVTAGCLVKDGHEVIGVDLVPSKVERLAAGLPTVVEPGLETLIAEGHRLGRLTATNDAQAAVLATDVSFICVGTPSRRDGSLDVSAVKQTADTIGEALRAKRGRHVVILRSTVPAGTTESVVWPALRLNKNGDSNHNVGLVIVPEFLREGSAIADYYDPPFVVVGSVDGEPDENEEVLEGLFGGVTDQLRWIPFREAEMLKAVCNVFHALKIVFANEVGTLCSALSVDGQALMAQLVQDHKLNISPAYLKPGLPYGGSCLPKDLRMILHLANREQCEVPLLWAIMDSNEVHLKRLIQSIPDGYRRIGLDGLAFKMGTDDMRESPMVLIAEYLIGKGYDLKILDPLVEKSRLTGANRNYIEKHLPHLSSRLVHTPDELLEHAEVLLLTRNDPQLLERAAQLDSHPYIHDLVSFMASCAPDYARAAI